MSAHPFRRKVLETIDALGARIPYHNAWRLEREGWDLIYTAGDLMFYKPETEFVVWSDHDGGQQVEDLSPYEELLNRWMVLERLADVGRSEQDGRLREAVSDLED